jgi:hypothetical protein
LGRIRKTAVDILSGIEGENERIILHNSGHGDHLEWSIPNPFWYPGGEKLALVNLKNVASYPAELRGNSNNSEKVNHTKDSGSPSSELGFLWSRVAYRICNGFSTHKPIELPIVLLIQCYNRRGVYP